ncbi:MAG: agmatine deiminase family protein [Gammaproteobacteria bacterium]|nr:agmatine deiminase family protein [Gammaproteobacteria bacterium]
MPAEWEPHAGTWLSWPHNRDTWPGRFDAVEPAYAEMVRILAACETVHVNVLDAGHERHVGAVLEAHGVSGRIIFHRFATNDAWCRDHGAIFVTRAPELGDPLAAIDCDYNAWGGKYPPFDLDAGIPRRMAEFLGIPRYRGGMVLEGGSIDVNGAGTLLTTEQCLLHPNRNPELSRAQIEARLRGLFCAAKILWLGEGIAGDDTDGHVDDLTRFVAHDTVVTVVETDPDDANYAPLRANRERLAGMSTADGAALEVIELPMPAPRYHDGQRLPASYANFLIANGAVLLPVFGDPMDREAERVLARCFPDRRIEPVFCLDLVWGLGAVHCLTQQIPQT